MVFACIGSSRRIETGGFFVFGMGFVNVQSLMPALILEEGGPSWVAACPSIAEICLRKIGARQQDGRFVSGTIPHLTCLLD